MAGKFVRFGLTRLKAHPYVLTVDTFQLRSDESFCIRRFTWVQPLKMREPRVVTMATLRWGREPGCPRVGPTMPA